MKRALLILLLCLPALLPAQTPALRHYTTSNGLISNNTYNITQDARGFLWIATEAGVSRFNGTGFTGYTQKKDGLGDDEILAQVAAGPDRIWFWGFNRQLSYYSHAARTVYSIDTDSLLRNNGPALTWQLLPTFTAGTPEGEMWGVCQAGVVYRAGPRDIHLYRPGPGKITFVTTKVNGRLLFGSDDGLLFTVAGKELQQAGRIQGVEGPVTYHGAGEGYLFVSDKAGRLHFCRQTTPLQFSSEFSCRLPLDVLYIYRTEGVYSGYWVQTQCDGAYWFPGRAELQAGHPKLHLLKNVCLRNIFIDSEKNIWFATHTNGVYCLTARNRVSCLPFDQDGIYKQPLTCINGQGSDNIWVGNSSGAVVQLANKAAPVQVMRKYYNSMRIKDVLIGSQGDIWCATDEELYRAPKLAGQPFVFKNIQAPRFFAIKALAETPGGDIWVGTCCALYRIRGGNLQQVDTVAITRITALCTDGNGTVWVAAKDSLFSISSGSKARLSNWQPPPGKTISAMAATGNGLLWVGMQGDGLKVLRQGQLLQAIDEDIDDPAKRLASNFCRSIFAAGDHTVWVATNRGLNKITVAPTTPFTYNLFTYSRADGLDNDDVSGVYAYGGKVWAVTPTGINTFTDSGYWPVSKPVSWVEDAKLTAGVAVTPGSSLKHKQNSLVFNFTAVALRGGTPVEFEVRLSGYDTAWHSSTVTSVQYTSLQPGQYSFYVRSRYRNGGWGAASPPFTFTIQKAWWQTTWFRIAAAVFILAFFILLAGAIKKRTRRKVDAERQLAELRLEAVRAQMNPHFIYNCLNCIQYYIGEKDSESAQYYLAGFAKLIRNTLDYSKKSFITLAEEITFISNYLSLEKMRLEEQLTYNIVVEGIKDTAALQLPPLLLQPYIENAIRHGIKPLRNRRGLLTVSFSCTGTQLHCVIEDNGVGRARPVAAESGLHGMAINSSRVDSLNMVMKKKISLAVTDKSTYNNSETGTRVTIIIPIKINSHETIYSHTGGG